MGFLVAPQNSPVVSSVPRGAAASILRNQISDLRYQSSVLDREAASQSSAAERPLPSLLHLKAGSVGSVHYSEPRLTRDIEGHKNRKTIKQLHAISSEDYLF